MKNILNTKLKLNKIQIKWIVIASYVLLPIAVVFAYSPAKEVMTVQTAWINIIKSNITLNVFLAFFVWGLFVDKFTKKMPKKVGWAILIAGTVTMILIFKFLGKFPTIFDW